MSTHFVYWRPTDRGVSFAARVWAIEAAIIAALATNEPDRLSGYTIAKFVRQHLPWTEPSAIYERIDCMVASGRIRTSRRDRYTYPFYSLPGHDVSDR
jgi:hypothetical protein